MGKIIQAKDANGIDRSNEWNDFKNSIQLDEITSGRYSLLFLIGLFIGTKQGSLNPWKVVAEISALEGKGPLTNTKGPAAFTRDEELLGLWHKHYLAEGIAPLACNIKNALKSYGIPYFEARVKKVLQTGIPEFVTAEDIPLIASDITFNNYAKRAEEGRLTGEWIIFAKHENLNYYLCLGNHGSDIAELRSNIEKMCFQEFPFLEEQLSRDK